MFELEGIGIPVSVFLIVYGGYMLFYVLYSLFTIYHFFRYGIYGFGLYLIITIFTGGTILLVSGSVLLLLQYDWQAPIMAGQVIETYNTSLFPDA